MEKFDQPELHPRGFPLWVNILLVSALILAPIVAVAVYQAWQDKQAASQTAPAPAPAPSPSPAATETESKSTSADDSATEKPADAEVKSSTETKVDAPAENKPAH